LQDKDLFRNLDGSGLLGDESSPYGGTPPAKYVNRTLGGVTGLSIQRAAVG